MAVEIQKTSCASHIPTDEQFNQWVSTILAAYHKSLEVSIRVVDLDEMATLNKKYRGKSGATNVLSFPMTDSLERAFPLLGDILICAPVIEQEALEAKKDIHAHWAHIVVHGVLHLLGFDHENASDAEIMEGKEVEWLEKFGFSNPYQNEKV